jgi:hypothetical protein
MRRRGRMANTNGNGSSLGAAWQHCCLGEVATAAGVAAHESDCRARVRQGHPCSGCAGNLGGQERIFRAFERRSHRFGSGIGLDRGEATRLGMARWTPLLVRVVRNDIRPAIISIHNAAAVIVTVRPAATQDSAIPSARIAIGRRHIAWVLRRKLIMRLHRVKSDTLAAGTGRWLRLCRRRLTKRNVGSWHDWEKLIASTRSALVRSPGTA